MSASTNIRMKHAEIRWMAILRGTGHTQEEIAKQLNVSSQTISYHLKKLREESIEKGVDETLSRVFTDAMVQEHKEGWHDHEEVAIAGLVSLQLKKQNKWWEERYRTNAHWLIWRMWQLCHLEGEELEQVKNICKAVLPAYCDSYGYDIELQIRRRKQ